MEKCRDAVAIESIPSMSQASSSSHAASTYEVRKLDKSEYKQAGLCLAQAFKDDDVAMYFIKTGDRPKWTPEDEWNLHLHIMECLAYAHCLKGSAFVIGPNYDCVALWYFPTSFLIDYETKQDRLPPGGNIDGFCTLLRSGLMRLNFKLSKEGKKRFFTEFIPLLHNTKHEVLGEDDDDSWYLVYIGTKPDSRGKGYARALIEHVTKLADRDNRTSYLECSNPMNLKLYGRLGFKFVKKICLNRGEKPVEMDIMTRPSMTAQLAGKTVGFGARDITK
ncbi:hypothetical protein ACLMJK_003441 [Lecanora helva]